VIGLNLGANKDSDDRAGDFAKVLGYCGGDIDFATVNVSSPNTERLRDLQGKEALTALLNGVLKVRDGLPRPIPVFLKIAPDLNEQELADVADVARATGIDAIIATNTTLSRNGLTSRHRDETGGLSGEVFSRLNFSISTVEEYGSSCARVRTSFSRTSSAAMKRSLRSFLMRRSMRGTISNL